MSITPISEHPEIVGRMAQDIIKHTEHHGYCTVDDLVSDGYTMPEINRWKTLARGIAGMTLNAASNQNFEPSEK